jgi:glycosyltransferase involved in cell wall biosynthesis
MVLHEATRTGAPRVGGLIAEALQPHAQVEVVALRTGPLKEWLDQRLGAERVRIVERGWYRSNTFEARVRSAEAFLLESDCDLVYVNSIASSEFLVAASSVGKKSVLHLHEKTSEMESLLRQGVTKANIVAFTPAMILAGTELIRDFQAVFGVVPDRVLDWGIAVDVDEILTLSRENAQPAPRGASGHWAQGARLCVGMVGHASRRKGSDIFVELARRLPENDFIWVGDWPRKRAPDNPVPYKEAAKVPNLYATGGVANPYAFMKDFDLFFLTSREDPNPLVVAEAMILGVPVIAFSSSTAVPNFLGRNAILCHGSASVDRACRMLKRFGRQQLKIDGLVPRLEQIRPLFDINAKIAPLLEMLKSL